MKTGKFHSGNANKEPVVDMSFNTNLNKFLSSMEFFKLFSSPLLVLPFTNVNKNPKNF